jgi:hypothetical protein
VVRDAHKIGVFEEKKKGRSDKIGRLPFSFARSATSFTAKP